MAAIGRLDGFGRPIIATVDGAPASNPWGFKQQQLLIPTRRPAPAAPVPVNTFPGGVLRVLDQPVIGDPAVISPGGWTLGASSSPASSSGGSSSSSSAPAASSGGCFMCSAMGTGASGSPAAAASVAAAPSGGGISTASLLTAPSGAVPWWLLVIGAAAAGWLFHKLDR